MLSVTASLKGSSEHSKHYRNEYLNKRPSEGRRKTGVLGSPAVQNSQDLDCKHLSLWGSHRKVGERDEGVAEPRQQTVPEAGAGL